MADLTLRQVRKSFGNLTILQGIDLEIKSGEFIVFVGPSGCGKSTLLRMIAGLEEITDGEISIAGEVVNHISPSKRGIAMVFQSYALYPHMSVYDNMAFGMKIARESKAEIDRRVRQAAEILQLTKYLGRMPKALSGGQRQRVAIARAIASQPKLLLLDEPLSALDAKLREAMQVEIRLLQQRLGITTIMVTHDQREAMTMADEIVVMEKGRIAQVGKPLDIYRDPVSEFVADFIGLGNILPVTYDGAGGVSLPGGRRISVAQPARVPASSGDIRLLIRPEDVCVKGVKAASDAAGPNRLQGTVTFIRDVGASLEATIDCAGFTLTAATTPRETPGLMLGMPVFAELPPHACKLIAARASH